ncbi:MAG TPA: hypothetical protein VF384_12835 [Planctomycetota bacterium]
MIPFVDACRALIRDGVRFVVIGVWGANYYARSAGTTLATLDLDAFLPLDAHNLVLAWKACQSVGCTLWAGDEPLGPPTLELAEAVVARRALTTAVDDTGAEIDLTLTMTGFSFAEVDAAKASFLVDGVSVPVARLAHIVRSKMLAGRPKDQLFLTSHRTLLDRLMRREGRA